MFNTALLALNSLTLVTRMPLPSWYREGSFHMGDLSPALRGTKEGQRTLFALAISPVLLFKIINMLKWHSLGWRILNPYTIYLTQAKCASSFTTQRLLWHFSLKKDRTLEIFSLLLVLHLGKPRRGLIVWLSENHLES